MTEATQSEEMRSRPAARREQARASAADRVDTGRSIGEGIGFGLLSGAIFTAVWMLASAFAGLSALEPVRAIASVFFGQVAFQYSAGAALLSAAIVGVVLSIVFGTIYGLINAQLPVDAQTNVGTQAVLGLVYGAALWLVVVQVIGRFAFPWFLQANQLGQFLLHTLFFGLPLGLMYGGAEHRALTRPARRREAAQPA